MKKLRSVLAVIALVVTLSGISLQGAGASALASAANRLHLNSSVASVQVSKSLAYRHYGPCPGMDEMDC